MKVSIFHPLYLYQKCHPLSSLLLLEPGVMVACCCQCQWCSLLEHWDGGLFPCVPLSLSYSEQENRIRQAGSCSMSSAVRFVGPTATGERAGTQSCGCLYVWRNGVPDPIAAAAQLPMAIGTAVARRLELCAPPALWLPGSLGLWARRPQLEDQD